MYCVWTSDQFRASFEEIGAPEKKKEGFEMPSEKLSHTSPGFPLNMLKQKTSLLSTECITRLSALATT